MRSSRHARVVLLLALTCACIADAACRSSSGRVALPSALADQEFWDLITRLSEPAGTFTHSDNLVSNETHAVHTIRMLRPAGGGYIGVGPEQNFSYIARLEPQIAFIVDIRRENRDLHLMYKALFELSSDRADFAFRLFSRERPEGVRATATVQELFRQLGSAKPSAALKDDTARMIRARLTETHRFPVTPQEVQWIEHSLEAFYSQGPDLNYYYGRPPPIEGTAPPSYRSLMTSTDLNGESRSYLATDAAFSFLKDLQARNLIVPVVGDFGGPSAIRRVGEYVREHRGQVTAFYSSNVEVYLSKEQTATFCGGLAALPLDSRAWFIDGKGVRQIRAKLARCESLPR